jgi:hypothetical protein
MCFHRRIISEIVMDDGGRRDSLYGVARRTRKQSSAISLRHGKHP